MELRVTFGLENDEFDGDVVDVNRVDGLRPEDLPELENVLQERGVQARVSVLEGSIGKGYAGPGVELILTITEHAMTDLASVLGIGGALWALIHKVQARRNRRVVVQQPEVIGALAVTAASTPMAGLAGGYIGQTVCLTGGGPGLGTDVRDVWATCVFLQTEDVWIVFSSPSGLVLGQVTVPPEWTSHRGALTASEIASTFTHLNLSTST